MGRICRIDGEECETSAIPCEQCSRSHPKPENFCSNCYAPIEKSQIFCCETCEKEHEWKLKKINNSIEYDRMIEFRG